MGFREEGICLRPLLRLCIMNLFSKVITQSQRRTQAPTAYTLHSLAHFAIVLNKTLLQGAFSGKMLFAVNAQMGNLFKSAARAAFWN